MIKGMIQKVLYFLLRKQNEEHAERVAQHVITRARHDEASRKAFMEEVFRENADRLQQRVVPQHTIDPTDWDEGDSIFIGENRLARATAIKAIAKAKKL